MIERFILLVDKNLTIDLSSSFFRKKILLSIQLFWNNIVLSKLRITIVKNNKGVMKDKIFQENLNFSFDAILAM